MPKAPPSSRATDHVSLSFGLVNIPVSIYSGTDSNSGINRKQFLPVPVTDEKGNPVMKTVTLPDGTTEERPAFVDHPVGKQDYDKETGEPVPFSAVQRKVETEFGFVYVEDHEIETLFELSPRSLIVQSFQPQHLFYQGDYVPKGIAFVQASKMPGKGRTKVENKGAQKALATVLEGMREEGAMALCELTSRGIPKPAILMPDGTLWLLHHTDDLREQPPLPEIETNAAEVTMVRSLMKALWDDAPQDLTDQRAALIQTFADEKAQAGDFSQSVEVEVETTQQDTSSDFMAILAASVQAVKNDSDSQAV